MQECYVCKALATERVRIEGQAKGRFVCADHAEAARQAGYQTFTNRLEARKERT